MTEPSRSETIQPSHRHAIGYPLGTESVRSPVESAIAIRVYRHASQDVCPWNVRFATELKEPTFAARAVIGEHDARMRARELLAMSPEFSRALKGSPMKRAKLRGLKREAAVALGNVGTAEDADVLTQALDDDEPLLRAHAAWALAQLRRRGSLPSPTG